VSLLLAATLLITQPVRGEVPRHEHAEHNSMQHDGHDMAHGDHNATQDGSTPAAHVHPAPAEVPPEAVGLDEKLGTKIPLDLTFRDEQGRPLKLSSLVTKPTVIAPIYYRCPNVCHFLQGDLARILPQLKLKPGEDFQVISISFDETEQPSLASRSRGTYMAAMNNAFPEQGWRFLTGEKEQIKALTEAIGFRFQRVGTEFLHPVALVVVSPGGQIIRYLHGTHIVPKDLTLALYEAKAGRVGATIRKVVQYCFSFDPEQKTYVFNLLRISATVILLTLGAFLTFLIITGNKKGKVSKHD
jgi:protein SCO1/2